MDMIQDAVGFVEKKEMKLSEIHEMVIEAAKKENSNDSSGEISFYADIDEKHKWVKVCFDVEKDKSMEKCAFEFLASTDDKRKTIFMLKQKQNWFESERHEITPIKMAQLTEIEHKLFRLYSARVQIEVDDINFENEWYRYED